MTRLTYPTPVYKLYVEGLVTVHHINTLLPVTGFKLLFCLDRLNSFKPGTYKSLQEGTILCTARYTGLWSVVIHDTVSDDIQRISKRTIFLS